ncbi:UDP-glucose 4-epimerase [Clostridium bornimense]|uniref:UDP-glucose 4-epimerase n=1 Tax=Clostridium bornimense TaxID=1216932 RepID=W6RV08_9CLOT|nr:UDP-glucose 4-epimerase GalE [Clostridium bornimense]CDM68506.1 UDP-glucose 4-epimerase [Clostridium bornimense]
MKILVTGGAGYIGSHATYLLIERGFDVVVVDNLSTGHKEAVHEKAKFYEGDIGDYKFISNILKEENIDGVIHFAAFSLVGESMENPYKYYENNVAKTNNLLKAMVDFNVKNIVFSSTAATYGEPKTIPILESDETNPTNVYGETKLSMEKMIKWYNKAYGLKYVCLRYFNVAGAHSSGDIGEAHNPETHLIPIILQVASGRREKINVYGNDYDTKDGTCIRDYVHVIDLVDAHIKAIEYLFNGSKSDVFNLGSGEGFTVYEMIEAARKVTGDEIPLVVTERRAGDPAKLIASSEKAREILGWKPKFEDITKMIKDAWNWEQNKKY